MKPLFQKTQLYKWKKIEFFHRKRCLAKRHWKKVEASISSNKNTESYNILILYIEKKHNEKIKELYESLKNCSSNCGTTIRENTKEPTITLNGIEIESFLNHSLKSLFIYIPYAKYNTHQ